MILKALEHGSTFHAIIFKLHIVLGCREGSNDEKSGLTGLSWDRFKDSFTLVDVYERKVKKGIVVRAYMSSRTEPGQSSPFPEASNHQSKTTREREKSTVFFLKHL